MSEITTIDLEGIAPAAATETEWFTVPEGHEYGGTIRASHTGSAGTGTTTYKIAVVSSSGAATTQANFHAFNRELEEGDINDITFELPENKAVIVESDNGFASFNFSGRDKNNVELP